MTSIKRISSNTVTTRITKNVSKKKPIKKETSKTVYLKQDITEKNSHKISDVTIKSGTKLPVPKTKTGIHLRGEKNIPKPKEKTVFKDKFITNKKGLENLKNYDIIGALTIKNKDIKNLYLPKLNYTKNIYIETGSYSFQVSKELDNIKIPYNLLNTPHEKEIRTFAKNNNLPIQWRLRMRTLLEDKKKYKLSELDPNSTSNKTILKEHIRGDINITNTSDMKKIKDGDYILGHLNIQNTDINTLILPKLDHARLGINIEIPLSGMNIFISKNMDHVKVPNTFLNTSYEKEIRTFAKNNNLPIKWQSRNGTVLDDKKEYKLSDLDPNNISNKTILRKNIRLGDMNIRNASDIKQLKDIDCILGTLYIDKADINTLILPQLSYIRDGINITTTSGYNLSISRNLDSVKISHTYLNTPEEKEIRKFAKNNNLTIKLDYGYTLLNDKKEYRLSELDPDSTSNKTILRKNIRGDINITNISDIEKLKESYCILGYLFIKNIDINTLILPQLSYIRDGINIATKSDEIYVSKNLDNVKINYNLLNTPEEKEIRVFAKNNNLPIKWMVNGILLDDKKEYKLSELDPGNTTSNKTILRENIRGDIDITDASDIEQLKNVDCILGTLYIGKADISTLKLPNLSYVTDGIYIGTKSGENLFISKDLDSMKIPLNSLNTPEEKEIRKFAKNNNLLIK